MGGLPIKPKDRMKLTQLRICNFQSFGPAPTTIDFAQMTFLLGPNGAGKTVVLQALARLFGFDPSLRRMRRTDFHISPEALAAGNVGTMTLWIEAEFEFPELVEANGQHATIPGHFAHMQLDAADGVPRVRFRLTASLDEDGDVEEKMHYVIHVDAKGEPVNPMVVPKHDRNSIQVHYLPARRDPTEHISYTASSLLGRTLRAANWQAERATVAAHTQGISAALAANAGVQGIGEQLAGHWLKLHKGSYYANPSVSFEHNEIDNLLRHLTVGFTPGHEASMVDFSRLSDGQQSLLYVSLVLAVQGIGRRVLAGELDAFDVDRLRPAVFTLMAMEEPENSLSPHYLGRVIKALTEFAGYHDAQAVVATHAPSLLRRVPPESIRYLRLDAARCTTVKTIIMPAKTDEAHKFVREAVQAFPELYFSRLVILGEGDSEEIVLPRLLQARGLADDDTSLVVAPLGGAARQPLLAAVERPTDSFCDIARPRCRTPPGRMGPRALCAQAARRHWRADRYPDDRADRDIACMEWNRSCITFSLSSGLDQLVGRPRDFFLVASGPRLFDDPKLRYSLRRDCSRAGGGG